MGSPLLSQQKLAMDPLLLLALAAAVAALILAITYFQSFFTKSKKDDPPAPPVEVPEAGARGGPPRRIRGVRNRLEAARARAAEARNEAEGGDEEDGVEEEEEEEEAEFKLRGKIGTKRMRRLEQKAEKKAQREQEQAMREDKKRREALKEKERKEEEEKQQLLKEKEEEEQRKLKEEQERKEHEEYLKMKASFVIEEEGEAEDEEEGEGSKLREFIDYVKRNKIVYLEDLAAEFGLRAQDAISRVQTLRESGDLTGLVDDRGKFIYISQEELEAVARFINQRGRVSIAELAASSSSLINLHPEAITAN